MDSSSYETHLLYIRGGDVPDGQDLVFTNPAFLALPTTHLMVLPDGTWGGYDVTQSLHTTAIMDRIIPVGSH